MSFVLETLPLSEEARIALPTVTIWNRLESRPQRRTFDRALRTEVRDALWFLTRQWQAGELDGDDAASPVFAKAELSRARLTRFRPLGGAARPLSSELPLETDVEKRPLPLMINGRPAALDLRLALGRLFLRRIAGVGDATALRAAYLARWPVRRPDPAALVDADICAHPETHAAFAAAAGRALDGGALYLHLRAGGLASDGISAAGNAGALDAEGIAFVAMAERLIAQPAPDEDVAWEPERLEHRFELGVEGDDGHETLRADSYARGRLDWSDFDVDPRATPLAADPATAGVRMVATGIPAELGFAGMPAARWWAFEDAKMNFGAVSADTTDLAKLMLLEFALVYGNDWLMIPFVVPVGSLVRVEGLLVQDSFGERTWIEPAGRGDDEDWQRWAMFSPAKFGPQREQADDRVLLAPTLVAAQNGRAHEQVALIRDEMANLVWGVERIIPTPAGIPRRGAEAAEETLRHHERLLGPEPAPGEPLAPIRYDSMNTPPEHWIPFTPVRAPASNREVRLQRGVIVRRLGGRSDPIRPRTALLREGLEAHPQQPYFLNEEEVSRAGQEVTVRYERARWHDGRVVIWYAAAKTIGRGEGSSGLAFDRVVPTEKTS
jgi:hypothetical protein